MAGPLQVMHPTLDTLSTRKIPKVMITGWIRYGLGLVPLLRKRPWIWWNRWFDLLLAEI